MPKESSPSLRRRRSLSRAWAALVCLTLALLLSTFGGIGQAQESDVCDRGARLTAAGELENAKDVFLEAVKKRETLECGIQGLATVAAASADAACTTAGVLAKEGKLDKALDLYSEALRQESAAQRAPTDSCAASGLASLALLPESPASCARARRLQDLDRKAEAEAEFLKVLAANPREGCATRGLEDLKSARTPIQFASDWSTEELPGLLVFIVLALLALVVLYVLVMRILVRALARWSPWLRVWLKRNRVFRRPLRPRIDVQEFGEAPLATKVGAGVADRVRHLLRDSSGGSEIDMDLATGPVGPTLAGSLADLSAQAKGIAALVDLFARAFPAPRVTLKGNLYPGADGRPTVGLTLIEGSSVIGTETLSAPKVQDESDGATGGFLDLAVSTAEWVRAELRDYPAKEGSPT